MPAKAGCERHFLQAEPMAVRHALQAIEQGPLLQAMSADGRDCALLVLAEMLNNVAEHAYAGQGGPVGVVLRNNRQALCGRVFDWGTAPNWQTLPDPGLPDPAQLPQGGFGWGLIRILTQNLWLRRRGACTVLGFELRDNVCAEN